MATSEIEKLERRYAENPQGLTFAPLAEVHRKSGDIPRALELLKSGLELHPNYIPASIVLGRCHWDQGDLPAAESAFAHVLRLDDENVIALKSLAEISERLGRISEAQRWLKRLISIDRSNEEARQHLTRLEGVKAEAVEVPPAPAQATNQEPETPKAVPGEPSSLDLTAAIADPPLAEQENRSEPAPPAVLEFLDTSEPARRTETPAKTAEPAPVLKDDLTSAQPMQVDGLISQEFVPPKDGGYRLHPELTQEFGAPPADVEQLEVETAGEVELQSSGAAEFRVPNAAEDFMEAAREPEVPELTIEPPPPAPPPPQPAPRELALREVAAHESLAPSSPPSTSPPATTPVRTSYSVRDTGGQSVAAFFQAMLSARPSGGSPTQTGVAQDGRSPGNPTQAAGSPTGAARGPVLPASGPLPDAEVSFDDFFGAATGGAAAPKDPDAGKDDLDQFQSWLQNLKR